MIPLINKSDLDKFKYVADSVKNETIWGQFVSEAQMLDVKIWLGDALLMELIAQGTTAPTTFSIANQILLEGGTYNYSTDNYHFQGLKAAIIYYAFARYTNRAPFNYTAAGIVLKDSDLSTPVSDKVIQRLETEARLTADAIRDEVILFLNRNYTLYPLWNNLGCRVYSTNNRLRFLGD
jgi:hypothetical protein